MYLSKSLVHKSQFTAISKSVQQGLNPRWNSDKPYGHVIGQRHGTLIQMELNRGHKNNHFTPLMIQEIQRFFKSYEIDDVVQMIWLQSSHSEVFSRGTDLKYLLVKVLENRPIEATKYLQQVQGMAHTFASHNKPTLAYVRGEIAGSAAAMMGTLPFVVTDESVRLWVNDAYFGFVPHGGASYVLSRLPREVGVYMAVTGQVIGSKDLQTLRLSSFSMKQDPGETMEFARDVLLNGVQREHTDAAYGNMFQWWRKEYLQGQNTYLQHIEHELQLRTKSQDPDLAEDPRSVLAEVLFKHELVKDANLKRWTDDNNIPIKQNIQNYQQHFSHNVLDVLQAMGYLQNDAQLSTSFENPAIVRCFQAHTVEEIVERLKYEGSEWSNGVIAKIQLRSPLLLKLTLKLLRSAENSTWQECLQTEFLVGSRVLRHPDFAIGVGRIGKKTQQQLWTHKSLNQVSDQEVLSYFAEEDAPKLIVDALENSFHPVKQFYQKYPDNVRKYLNEETLYGDWATRANQDVDVLAFLKNNNLPYADQSVGVADIRRVLMTVEKREQSLQLKLSRLFSLCSSLDNLRTYNKMRQTYIQSRFDDEASITSLIDSSTESVFKERFNERTEAYRHIAETSTAPMKAALFSSTRNAILNKRLTTEDVDGVSKWHDPSRMLFFPTEDSVSFVNTYNKSLDDTTLFKKLYQRMEGQSRVVDVNAKRDYQRQMMDGDNPGVADSFDRLHRLYDPLYGDPTKVFDLSEYHNRLIEAGKASQGIQKYLQSNDQQKVLEIMKENKKLTEDEIAQNIFNLVKQQKSQDEQEFNEDKELLQNILTQTQKDLKQLSFEHKLRDLSQQANNKQISYDQQTIKQRLFNYINSEPQLAETLQPILMKTSNKTSSAFKQRYETLLLQIYSAKFKVFLNEHNQLLGLQTGLLDDLLNSQVEGDLNKLIEADVLFSFSYLVFQDLDNLYQALYQVSQRTPQHSKEYQKQMELQVNQVLGIQVSNPEEFALVMQMANRLMKSSATLYEVYKDNIHFSSQKQLLALMQVRSKKAADEDSDDHVVAAINRAHRLNRNKPLWSKTTLLHYIENRDAAMNDNMQQIYQRRLQDELAEWQEGAMDYHTGIMEKRAWFLLRQNDQRKLREWVPGMQHYLKQIDLVTAQAQRSNESLTPNDVQDRLDEMEKIASVFAVTNNLPLKEWFEEKARGSMRELFNLRRKYELKISREELEQFDQELSLLLSPANFKQTLLRSLDREMDELNEIARTLQINNNLKRDKEIDELKIKNCIKLINNYNKVNTKPSNDLPLLMTAAVAPLYFDTSKSEMQMLPTSTHLEIEVQQAPHPLKRGRRSVQRAVVAQPDELRARLRKLSGELAKQSEPAIEAMQQQDILTSNIRNELEYLSERINLRNQIKKQSSSIQQ